VNGDPCSRRSSSVALRFLEGGGCSRIRLTPSIFCLEEAERTRRCANAPVSTGQADAAPSRSSMTPLLSIPRSRSLSTTCRLGSYSFNPSRWFSRPGWRRTVYRHGLEVRPYPILERPELELTGLHQRVRGECRKLLYSRPEIEIAIGMRRRWACPRKRLEPTDESVDLGEFPCRVREEYSAEVRARLAHVNAAPRYPSSGNAEYVTSISRPS